MKKAITTGLALALCTSACGIPDDGVLALAFLLEPPPPSETRVAPPEAETGIAPSSFGAAHGRCDATPAAQTLRCTFAGLPATGRGGSLALSYEFQVLLWYAPLTARFDARSVERDPGGHDPDAPPPPMAPPLPRANLGPLAPDSFGNSERTFTGPALKLDQIVGGELFVLVPREGQAPGRYLVIDGRLGNLSVAGQDEPAPPAPGHHH